MASLSMYVRIVPVYSGNRSSEPDSSGRVVLLAAADVELRLDRRALGLERLGVDLGQDHVLGEVRRADGQRDALGRRAGGVEAVVGRASPWRRRRGPPCRWPPCRSARRGPRWSAWPGSPLSTCLTPSVAFSLLMIGTMFCAAKLAFGSSRIDEVVGLDGRVGGEQVGRVHLTPLEGVDGDRTADVGHGVLAELDAVVLLQPGDAVGAGLELRRAAEDHLRGDGAVTLGRRRVESDPQPLSPIVRVVATAATAMSLVFMFSPGCCRWDWSAVGSGDRAG